MQREGHKRSHNVMLSGKNVFLKIHLAFGVPEKRSPHQIFYALMVWRCCCAAAT